MKEKRVIAGIIAAGLVAGLALLGLFVKQGFESITANQRSVSVRGLAEREVNADYVSWPVTYRLTGNDLQAIYAEVKEKNAIIRRFIEENGVPSADINVEMPKVEDLYVNAYVDRKNVAERYNAMITFVVSTKHVDAVNKLLPRMGELLPKGIVIGNDYSTQPSYEFRGLNGVKTDMIAEATKNARAAADKFAEDSGSEVGKIKNAQQGLFSIESVGGATPWVMKVRVVTSVEFYIED